MKFDSLPPLVPTELDLFGRRFSLQQESFLGADRAPRGAFPARVASKPGFFYKYRLTSRPGDMLSIGLGVLGLRPCSRVFKKASARPSRSCAAAAGSPKRTFATDWVRYVKRFSMAT